MTLKVLPDDPRLWDVQRDARLYLIHAVFFLVAIVIVALLAKSLMRPPRRL